MAQDFKLMDDFMEAKTRLKAYTDGNGYEKPNYETVSKRIDDFRKIYKVRVTIDGLVEATGEGYSRRLAEYRAAINAMIEIKEVREEQNKSKKEELIVKEKNGLNNSDSHNDSHESNDTTDVSPVSNEESAQQLNGGHNKSEDHFNDNDINQQNNSIIISADINTSAEEQEEDNQKLVNGHNGDNQSQGSSGGSPQNSINGSNEDNCEENGENSKNQINGKRSEFLSEMTGRTFQPIKKSPVQQLHDFCMEKQSPYPFYDTTYKDRIFLIKCRIEFTEDDEKREFFGTGTGNTSKEAKMMAASDIIEQLTDLSFI